MRKNEIRTLRWDQTDFDRRTITVGRTKTQAGTGRLIPLNQSAFDALAKWAGRLVESRASEHTLVAIAGHVSRTMIEHYSHIRIQAKRDALDAIAQRASDRNGAQNWVQSANKEKSAVRN